jgi:hypothetical protein
MAEKLKKHLQFKAEEHSNLKLLQSQWNFDEELIPKALQNIAVIFSTYSRHDASHSRQILINIERLLGDTLNSLSATDTWLLLEAAYWHDIGMIVTSEEIIADMKTPEFKNYIEDIASYSGHELYSFAKKFVSLDPKNCFAAAETPQQAVELYRQILAGWYRNKHPKRAEEIISDPWKKAGISSPRNELLPGRLFRLLGQICRLHGSTFEIIMQTLEFCETGMGTEDCHPRFIACLLRLGDLFDLDDNRFCPVMLRIAGEIPPSSQAHIDKHASIRNFRLDRDRVEITAICQSYEGYETTDHWFHMIEDELRKQMTHWKDIVPNREFGLLPTLGKLEVNLEPPNEILDPGQRPRFTVDTQSILELFQGAGLYRDKWQSIRELLQNAVDANLIRIWLTFGENPGFEKLQWDNPKSSEIKKILDSFPITIRLIKNNNSDPKVAVWQLDIQDRGIGISKKDLKYMKSMGGSSKNHLRKSIISRMPKWLQPSGAFGIGLQSAFLISPEINFDTKSLLTGDTLKINLKSPIGPQKGFIFIQNNHQPYSKDYGTLASIFIDIDAVPQRVTINFEDTFSRSVLADFDPIRRSDIPYEAAQIVDEIVKFGNLSPVPIFLNFEGNSYAIERNYLQDDKNINYYDIDTGILLINPKFVSEKSHFNQNIFFRGQIIEKYRPELPFVIFKADLMTEQTKDTLTINRNDILETAHQHIYDKLVKAITNYINSKDAHLNSEEERAAASAFLYKNNLISSNLSLKNEWQNIILQEIGKSIKELCSQSNFDIYLRDSMMPGTIIPPEDLPTPFIESHKITNPRFRLLLSYWDEQKGYVQQGPAKRGSVLHFSKNPLPPFTDDYLKYVLLNRKANVLVGGRSCIPEWDDYIKLSSEVGVLPWCHSISDCHPKYRHFVNPFFYNNKSNKITIEGFDELIAWTLEHTLNPGVTKSDITDIYNKFINWVDNDLMKDSEEWKKRRDL